MFIKGEMVFADAYKYLQHKERNIVALSVKGSAGEYEEFEMNTPLEIEVCNGMVTWNHRMFANYPEALTKDAVKASIVKSRYSNDAQIAIMLNKDNSEEDTVYYQKMQEWRDFAAEIARLVEDK